MVVKRWSLTIVSFATPPKNEVIKMVKKYDSELFDLDDKDIKKKKSGLFKRDKSVVRQHNKKDIAQMLKDLDKEVEEKAENLPVDILMERDELGKVKFLIKEKIKDIEETGTEITEITEAFTEAIFEKTDNTIRNICLISVSSRNNRVYTDRALNNIVELARGVKVFADHPVKGQIRSVRDLIGKISAPRRAGDKIYGDLKVLSNQDWVFDIAKQMPEIVGMSIVARGKISPEKDQKGREQVESVLALKSIDLVSEPATTNSLFEQHLGIRPDGSIGAVSIGKKFDPKSPVCKFTHTILCNVYSELDKNFENCEIFKEGENCPYAEGGAFHSKS